MVIVRPDVYLRARMLRNYCRPVRVEWPWKRSPHHRIGGGGKEVFREVTYLLSFESARFPFAPRSHRMPVPITEVDFSSSAQP